VGCGPAILAGPAVPARRGTAPRDRDRVAGPPHGTAYDPGMSPGLILVFLVACLLGMIPVWRLHAAGWRPGVLFSTWLAYSVAILLVVRIPGPTRFVLPILVLAYVAPFVAGPERLSRLLGRRAPEERPVIDVTPPDDGDDDRGAGTSPMG
jgi:hypothetical protein